jgi:crotonobetainyl-CoA:carnitine CoA-transferase CaiB-like acyl-CoA transferase
MTASTMKTRGAASLPEADYTPGARGPLSGVKVIDLSRLVAGNMLTQQLADFGADVVKVEPRDGDTLRGWRVYGVETAWKLYSRNKRSLCLEFRHPDAMPLVKRLIPGAAMLIESFRPGTLEDMGLAPETLLAIEPRLVIVRISGWGQDGPYSRRPAFGTLVEGFSGFAEMNGFADREPVLPPMYLADVLAGLTGAYAAMAALREVEVNGGHGQIIDLPLLDPLVNALGPQAANYRVTGKVYPRTGSRSAIAVPRNVYRTKEGGWVALSASTQGMAERVMRAIGRPDMIDDPRYKDFRGHEDDGGEPRVLRSRRGDHRAGERRRAPDEGRACARPWPARRLPGRRHGRLSDAGGHLSPFRNARLDSHTGSPSRPAQPGGSL